MDWSFKAKAWGLKAKAKDAKGFKVKAEFGGLGQ